MEESKNLEIAADFCKANGGGIFESSIGSSPAFECTHQNPNLFIYILWKFKPRSKLCYNIFI